MNRLPRVPGNVLLSVAITAAIIGLTGCTVAAPAPASTGTVPALAAPVYVTVTISMACPSGSISVSVTHVAQADAPAVRAAIVSAFRSRAEHRLARLAVCHE